MEIVFSRCRKSTSQPPRGLLYEKRIKTDALLPDREERIGFFIVSAALFTRAAAAGTYKKRNIIEGFNTLAGAYNCRPRRVSIWLDIKQSRGRLAPALGLSIARALI